MVTLGERSVQVGMVVEAGNRPVDVVPLGGSETARGHLPRCGGSADGEVLHASQLQNPDLFWGLRGGGGNFGIVTEFEFRLHPIDSAALTAEVFYLPHDARQVLRRWRELIAEAPPQATLTAWAGTAGDWPFLPPELRNRPLASVGYVWAGDPDDGRRLIPALRGGTQPVAEQTQALTYLQLQSIDDTAQAAGQRRYWKGHYLRDFSDDAISAFLSCGSRNGDEQTDPALLASGELQAYGCAIASVGQDETAFSHRDALVELVARAGWTDPPRTRRESRSRGDMARPSSPTPAACTSTTSPTRARQVCGVPTAPARWNGSPR
jgi:hypothetical protein